MSGRVFDKFFETQHWTRAFAHDGRDPRSRLQTKLCRGQHVLEQSCTANQHGAWTRCARCVLRLHHVPRHSVLDEVRLNTVIGISVGGSGTSVTSERQRLHGEGGEDCALRSRGADLERRRLHHKTTAVYNIVCTSGAAASPTSGSGMLMHRKISTPPSLGFFLVTRRWRLFVVSLLEEESTRERRENALMMEQDLCRKCRGVLLGSSSEVHRWSMVVSHPQFRRFECGNCRSM